MRVIYLALTFVFLSNVNGQVKVDSLHLAEKFLEDQFYLGLTYNFLIDQPNEVNQQNLSYGLQAGFIKDIPITTDRRVAFGVGLGYGVNTYYSNLRATETTPGIVYSILDGDDNYKRNKLESHLMELPLELRWRNANATDYKFWRVYAGMKIGYLLSTRSKIVHDNGNISFSNGDAQNLVYGLTLSIGYNTFNLHAHYSLNNMFKDDAVVNGEPIVMRAFRIGLIFYIL